MMGERGRGKSAQAYGRDRRLTCVCECARPTIDDGRPTNASTFTSSRLARPPSSGVHHGMRDTTMRASATGEMLARTIDAPEPATRMPVAAAHRQNDIDWLIDNAETYGR